ncbi:YjbQ family protein [bacterium]|nr:MAG: YjbQ family protein [bacterium]
MVIQKEITLPHKSRGFHLITKDILDNFPELANVKKGIANIFIQHTSASITMNENADPTVRRDMERFFNNTVPEEINFFEHISEGPDDMTAHIKSSIIGSSVTIPVTDGKFNLGVWQGIYLCEHRNRGGNRVVIITVYGE